MEALGIKQGVGTFRINENNQEKVAIFRIMKSIILSKNFY